MSDYKGDFVAGATVRATFNSYAQAGESATITQLVATDVWIYRDGVIQSTVGAGVTVEINVGSVGSHRLSVDTSDTTDADFYEAGHDYEIKINGALIDTKTVNPFTAEWSTENRNNKVDLVSILGTALTETAGLIAAGFKKFFNIGTPTGTVNSLPDAVPGATGGGFIAGTNAATSITTALTANITGSLSGSVGTVAANGITATSLATDAINAASVKADAVTKIQNGLAPANEYDTQLDANISTRATSAKQDTMETTLNDVPTTAEFQDRTLLAAAYTIVADLGVVQSADNDTKLSTIISTGSTGPWTTGGGGDATDAKQDVILAKLLSYIRILARKDVAIATDDAAQITEINADEGAGAGAYNNTTDSQEAIKDAISGGGGTPGIT
jgi:hypothetical protein